MEETILLDCNHLQSSEFKGGNLKSNALFTCKIGEGISVNQGDKVSVHQTFISEVGSDDNSIQITDDFIASREFKYTLQTPYTYINGSNDKIMGYERITASNVTETIDVYNNKTNILYNYYITNHGENTFNLPRRFIYMPPDARTIDWNATEDTVVHGAPNEPNGLVTSVGAKFNGSNVNMFFCSDDFYYYQNAQSADAASNKLRALYNNSRFTLFTQTDTRYGAQTDGTLPSIINASMDTPAVLDYIEYIEKLEVSLKSGFQSPESIANDVNTILTKQTQPERGLLESTANFGGGLTIKTNRPFTTEINSPTYHTFHAASEGTMTRGIFDAWRVLTADNASGLNYLSAHQYIGIKRPNLYIKGREMLNHYKDELNKLAPNTAPNVSYAGFETLYDMNASQFIYNLDEDDTLRTQTIVLSLTWDNRLGVQEYLRDLINEQGNHPELFKNEFNQYHGFTNVNNSRFLHINCFNRDVRKTHDNNLYHSLGCDYYKDYTFGVPFLQTIPLFFDYNPEYKNIKTEGTSWDDGYRYGFMKKYKASDGFEYVALTTSHLGFKDATGLNANTTTIPNVLFLANDGSFTGSSIKYQTKLGWDAHFSSFGNVVMGIMSGWGYNNYDINSFNYQLPTAYNTTQLESNLYSRKLYVGANSPKLEYNSVSNRFEISNLHTSERVQNRYNAGSLTGTGSGVKEISTFDTAGDIVYKINKRIYNNTFTPDLLPYGANRMEGLVIQGETYNIDFLNNSLSAWNIFDQLSGIVIKDFGYDENKWTSSFWDTLGFDYNQFNAKETSDNDITTRVGNNNKNNLPYAFTNADVGQLATTDFITNIWGNGVYNLMLPQTMSFNVTNTGTNLSNYHRVNMKYEQFPAITESATSIKLEAPRLPRKLQSPYFCIRSDILDKSQYHGGFDSGELYPVIATIPKSNDFGDYFVQTDSLLEFTFTMPKTITSILTSIHNPDMRLANVNDSSAVIYKITRNLNPQRFNIIGQLLNPKDEKKPKL